jgi:hypothetical protein
VVSGADSVESSALLNGVCQPKALQTKMTIVVGLVDELTLAQVGVASSPVILVGQNPAHRKGPKDARAPTPMGPVPITYT